MIPSLRRLRFCLLRLRQANGEERASFCAVFARKRAAVGFDNAARDGQTHAGSFRFGREKCLEQSIHDSIRETRARISHAHADFAISAGSARIDDAAGLSPDNVNASNAFIVRFSSTCNN